MPMAQMAIEVDAEELPDTTTLRVATIMYRLCNGETFTTAQAAQIMGITHRGAYAMLDQISSSHEIPLTFVGGRWVMFIRGRDLPY